MEQVILDHFSFGESLPSDINEIHQKENGLISLFGMSPNFIFSYKQLESNHSSYNVSDGEYFTRINNLRQGYMLSLFEDGEITITSYKNNLNDGKYLLMSQDGHLKETGNFLLNKRDGLWTKYWGNGKRKEQGNYKNGEKDGFWKIWRIDGTLSGAGNYDKVKEGLWREWDTGGNLTAEKNFKNGRSEGLSEIYRNGFLESRTYHGLCLRIERYYIPEGSNENNERMMEFSLIGKDEESIYWDIKETGFEGQLRRKDKEWEENNFSVRKSYCGGDKDGLWEERYPNKQIKVRGNRIEKRKSGLWEKWYENGQRKKRGSYTKTGKNGLWEEWYENGQMKSRGVYTKKGKDGLWEEWDSDGTSKSKTVYQIKKDGKK